MLERMNDLVVTLSKSNRFAYACLVVCVMAVVGTALGLLADAILRCTGIKFEKYTDSHTK